MILVTIVIGASNRVAVAKPRCLYRLTHRGSGHARIIVTRYGGPKVITVAEPECPAPMPSERLIRTSAEHFNRQFVTCAR